MLIKFHPKHKREKVGYHLYVQDRHETEVKRNSGSKEMRKLFQRVGGLFDSVYEAQSFVRNNKHLEGRKIHIEGVRINTERLELPRRNDESTEKKSGTHR